MTHMRMPNDLKLAKEVPEFDLVLGGHDHDYKVHAESLLLLLMIICGHMNTSFNHAVTLTFWYDLTAQF